MAKKISIYEDAGLYTKFTLGAVFMFAVPLLLTIYILYALLTKREIGNPANYVRLIVFWMVVSGIFGYTLIRRAANNILNVIRNAKDASEGRMTRDISTGLHDDELKDLARAFNKITADLEKKIAELENSRNLTKELFQKLGYAVTSGQQLNAFLNIIIQSMAKVLKAETSFVALYDKRGTGLYVENYFGAQNNLSKNMKLPDDRGVIGLAINNVKPIMLEKGGIKALPEDEPLIYDNIMCIPIVAGGKVIGLLGVINQEESEKYRSENLPLLENIANQTAISIRNFELNKDIEDSYYETLVSLARVIEAKDRYTRHHLEKVEQYVGMMADKLKLDDKSKKILKGSAALHDLGKVGIGDDILNKESTFTPEEYDVMKQHAIIGENILKPLRSMEKLSKVVRHHHEFYDGSGYPDGLKGEEIPLLSRILTIADIYEALITERPYKEAMTKEAAMNTIKSYSGNKLDPKLVDIFIDLVRSKEDI